VPYRASRIASDSLTIVIPKRRFMARGICCSRTTAQKLSAKSRFLRGFAASE